MINKRKTKDQRVFGLFRKFGISAMVVALLVTSVNYVHAEQSEEEPIEEVTEQEVKENVETPAEPEQEQEEPEKQEEEPAEQKQDLPEEQPQEKPVDEPQEQSEEKDDEKVTYTVTISFLNEDGSEHAVKYEATVDENGSFHYAVTKEEGFTAFFGELQDGKYVASENAVTDIDLETVTEDKEYTLVFVADKAEEPEKEEEPQEEQKEEYTLEGAIAILNEWAKDKTNDDLLEKFEEYIEHLNPEDQAKALELYAGYAGEADIDTSDDVNAAKFFLYYMSVDGDCVVHTDVVDASAGKTNAYNGYEPTDKVVTAWTDGTNSYAPGAEITVTANMTLTPVTTDCYWVTFDTQGGSSVDSVHATSGEKINLDNVAAPTKAGYKFDGWSETPNGTKISGEYTVTKATTLYALYKGDKVNYQVVYWGENANDDKFETLLGSETKQGEAGTVAPAASAKSFSYFTYKSTDSNVVINAEGTTVVNVYYTRNRYKVTFDFNDFMASPKPEFTINGKKYTGSYSFTAKYEQDISALWPTGANVSKNPKWGFTYYFTGWVSGFWIIGDDWASKRLTMTEDLCNANGTTITAKWAMSTSKHDLNYMFEALPGESVDGTYKGVNYHRSEEYSQVLETDTSSQFTGKEITGMTYVGTETKNGKQYLYYTRNAYTLTLNNYGATSTMNKKSGASLSDVTNPARPTGFSENAVFKGWYTIPVEQITSAAKPVDLSTYKMPASNLELFAYWEEQPVKVTVSVPALSKNYSFDVKYGTSIVYTSDYATILSEISYSGKNFDKITTAAGTQFNVYQKLTKNTDLVITCKGDTFGITYDLNGGTGTVTDSMKYSYNAQGQVKDFTGTPPTDQDFDHWTDGTNMYYPGDPIVVTENITLKACYDIKLTLNVTPYSGVYDGGTHGEAATSNKKSATIDYSVDGGAWTTTVPTITDVGTKNVTARAALGGKVVTKNYTLKVDYKEITVTANDKTKVYGTNDPSFDAKVEGTIGHSTIVYSAHRVKYDNENVGDHVIEVTGKEYQGNYKVKFVNGNLKITPATMDVRINSYDKVYDGKRYGDGGYAVDTAGHGVPAIYYYSIDGGVTWDIYAPTRQAVGTINAKVKAVSDNYATVIKDYHITINPKAVTVTAPTTGKAYGDPEPTLTPVIDGLVDGEPEALIDYTISRAAGEEPGQYDITVTGAKDQGNYTVTYRNGVFTITRLTGMTVSGTSYKDAYDGQYHGEAATASVADATIKYSTDGGSTWNTDVPQIKDFGSMTVKVKAEHPHYQPAENTYTLEVTRKAVTVTANNKSKTYGETDPTLDATVSGTVGSETVNYTVTRTAGEDVAGSPYTITPSGAAIQGNYTVTYNPGTLTIGKATFTVSGTSYDKVYDGNTYGDAATATDMVNTTISYSTDGGINWTTTVPTVRDVAELNVKVKAENPNYFPAENSYSLKITRKPITITALDNEKFFRNNDPTLSAKVETLVSGDSVTYYVSRDKGEDVGTYAINVTGNAEQGNYSITFVPGTFTIKQTNHMTLTVTPYKDAYDGQAHGVAATAKGYGEDLPDATITYSTDGGQTWSPNVPQITNVGTINVTAKAVHKNFVTVTKNYTLEVTGKEVTVKANDKTKVYGETDPSFDAVVTGTLGTDTVTYSLTREAGEDVKAGGYKITPSGAKDQGNYTVKYEQGTLTITPAQGMTVSGTSYNDTYDAQLHGEAAVPSIAAGTKIWYSTDNKQSWTDTVPQIKNVGEMTVYVKTENNNYQEATCSYTLKVTPKDVTIKADNLGKQYGTHEPSLTAHSEGVIQGDSVTFIYSVSREAGEAVGTYAINVTIPQGKEIQGNYKLTGAPGVFTISKSKAQDVYPVGYNKTYDGQSHSASATARFADGTTIWYKVEGGDWTTVAPSIKDVGTVKVKVKAVNPSYEDVEKDCELKVTKKTVKMESGSGQKPYDGTPLTNNTVNDDGFVSGEGATYNVTGSQTDAGSSFNWFTYTMNANTKESNYDVKTKEGVLQVDKLDKIVVKVTGNTSTVDYNGTEQSATGFSVECDTVPYSTADLTYSGTTAAKGTDADANKIMMGLKPGDFTNVSKNFKTVDFQIVDDGWLLINPATITVTTPSASKTYNGTPLTADGTMTGLVNGETATFTTTGTQTAVGSSQNTYTLTWDGTAKKANYTVVENLGTLTVTSVPTPPAPTPTPVPPAPPVEPDPTPVVPPVAPVVPAVVPDTPVVPDEDTPEAPVEEKVEVEEEVEEEITDRGDYGLQDTNCVLHDLLLLLAAIAEAFLYAKVKKDNEEVEAKIAAAGKH